MNELEEQSGGNEHFGWLPAGDGYFGWLPQQDGCFTSIPLLPPVFRPNFTSVPRIVDLRLLILKSNPPQLLIRSTGEVTSTGWTTVILVPRFNSSNPPSDRNYEFTMIACPPLPGDPVNHMLSEITASTVLRPIPEGLRSVTVIASENQVTKVLLEDSEEMPL